MGHPVYVKALLGSFSVIVKYLEPSFEALLVIIRAADLAQQSVMTFPLLHFLVRNKL